MLILILKLLLVPSLLATVTVIARRWGPNVAGWVGSFPIVAGPVLLVITLEQGAAFGARAAGAAVAGIAPTMFFVVLYAYLSVRFRWWQAVLMGYLGWAVAVALLARAPAGLGVSAAIGCAGLALAMALVRPPPGPPLPQKPSRLELPARMLVGVLLTFVTSALAAAFGPRLAGYAAIFPLVASIVASFSHALHGRDPAVRFLAGMCRGMWSVAAFALVLALLLPRVGVAPAFLGSLAATAVLHAALRPRPAGGAAAPR
ncbi:MAG: hypothetical protein JNK40_11055 [Chromatiales bacterium]|nr:hypothetical protein [Chromatiales bacterium]